MKDVKNCSKCGVSPVVRIYRLSMVDEFYEISCPICNAVVATRKSESDKFKELALLEWNTNQSRRRKYCANSN